MPRSLLHDRGFSRREVLVLGAGAFVAAALPFAGRRRRRLRRRTVPMMGTVADLSVVTDDDGRASVALDAAVRALRLVETSMTRFDPRSDVGRANLGAAAGPVAIGPETRTVIEHALSWATSSDGAFDPCLGRAVALWDVTERDAPPPDGSWARLAGRRLYERVDVGLSSDGLPVVSFADPDVRIDLGGIAKGHGVDRAVRALREAGIEDGLVNVGGDLYALGRSEDGDPWRVGVRSPTDPASLIDTIDVEDGAVATSGDYERAFLHEGRTYHHLLDPRTAAPRVTDVHSVTVTGDSCLHADAAATALFGATPGEAARLLRARPDRLALRTTV